MGKLDGKVAIVTGAGTGIGKSAAKMLVQEGAKVVLAGRRIQPLDVVVDEIKATGGEAIARSVDLEDGDAAAELGRWVIETCGRVDILVNNAGHSSKARSIRWVGKDEWDSVFKVNVEGVYRLTQAVIGEMLKNGAGTVITVSSMAAVSPGLLGGAPYSAAKAASFNLMRGINAELRNSGIRACTIIPAEVDTPILDNRPLPPGEQERLTMMQPDDVAEAILLCATMPQRTLVEQIVLMPTMARDTSADLEAARNAGARSEQG